MKEQYIIIKHRNPMSVAERVSEAMDRGYRPYGNLFYVQYSASYVQAMKKENEISELCRNCGCQENNR